MKAWFSISSTMTTVLLLLSGAVFAHHGGAGYEREPSTLKGTVKEYRFQNPHTEVRLDVKDASGKVVTWSLEMHGSVMLSRNGWNTKSLKVGDEITLEGVRAKSGEPLFRATKLVKADGTRLACPGDGAKDCE
jgi:hypothetical protein